MVGIVKAVDKDPADASLRKVEIGGESEVAVPNIDPKGRKPATLNDLDSELIKHKTTSSNNAYGQDAGKIQKKKEAKVIDRMKERAQEDLEEQEKKMKLRRQ